MNPASDLLYDFSKPQIDLGNYKTFDGAVIEPRSNLVSVAIRELLTEGGVCPLMLVYTLQHPLI